MHKVLKRYFVREKETKQIIADFCRTLGVEPERVFGPNPRIELVETQEARIFIFNKTPFSAEIGGNVCPTLLFEEILVLLPRIVVDMGAIPHICNGADIMAPGIVRIDGEFGKDALLLVVDERHGKPIAIGRALIDSETMKATERGKVVKNLHHVGDGVWNLTRNLA